MIRIIRLPPRKVILSPRGGSGYEVDYSSHSWKVGGASILILAATSYAIAQMAGPGETQGRPTFDHPMMSSQDDMHSQMHTRMMQMMQGSPMHGSAGQHGMMGMHDGLTQQPTLAGQDAFGATKRLCKFCSPIRRPTGPR